MNLPAHGTASPDPSIVSVLKQHTKQQRSAVFPPGSAPTPPDEIVPDRLAVSTHRQVPEPPGAIPEAFCSWFGTRLS